MTPKDRSNLIEQLLDGEISEADFLRLEAELTVDAAARQEYYDRVALSVLLEAESATRQDSLPQAPTRRPRTTIPLTRFGFAVAVAAAIAMMLTIGYLSVFRNNNDRIADITPPMEQEASGYAVIAGQSEATWRDGQFLPNGSLVPEGQLHLASGIVQLELFSGVTVIIEGDAEFSLLSPMEMSVARGNVRARVPEPAHGFRIQTRDGQVVDLGTDFAVSVTAEQSEVHVLEGEVEWHPRLSNKKVMREGKAVRRSLAGVETEIEADTDRFIGAEQLRERLQETREAKRRSWQEFSTNLRTDPRLVAFYQTGSADATSRFIKNLASTRSRSAGDGAVVAASRSADRWDRPAGALDFSPTGSRVRMSIPGDYHSLTFLCWVKINSLDRWYNSLFLTDGHDQNEPHWQIMDDGRLFFSVKKRDKWDVSKGEKDKHVYYSPSFWNNSLSGQWLMIATTYDIDARLVKHYVNGKQLSVETIPDEYVVENVVIGNASLCNWGLPERDEPRFAVRNLNGSMDEFAMFSAALSETEIREIYKRGRP